MSGNGDAIKNGDFVPLLLSEYEFEDYGQDVEDDEWDSHYRAYGVDQVHEVGFHPRFFHLSSESMLLHGDLVLAPTH